jgi:S1-C subfamily serine protease
MNKERDATPNVSPTQWSTLTKIFRNVVKRIWPIIVAFFFAFLGIYLYNRIFPPPVPPSQNEIDESIYAAMASATPPAPYSTEVYQTILPSLVYIQTRQENSEEEGFGVGSGVVVNSNGDILTALHVVSDAVTIEVFFVDGSQSTAEIIATEAENDIAILRPHKLPEIVVPAILGSSVRMRVGDEAFAIGNPLGLVASLSAGVISGFDRSIPIKKEGEQRLDGLIQFDTAVNPGNSGGPLLNRNGQVIGIVTALANPSEQNFFVGIGFAVPIGTAIAAGGGGPEY